MPDMQRTGGIGRNKFDLHFAPQPAVVAAEQCPLLENSAHDGLVAVIREKEVDEPGTGDFGACHQWAGWQGSADQSCQLTRLPLRGLGERQRNVARQIAMTFVTGVIQLHLWRNPGGQQALRNE